MNKARFSASKPTTVVALVHPAGRKLGSTLNSRRYRGAKGEAAEMKMLERALKKCGLKK